MYLPSVELPNFRQLTLPFATIVILQAAATTEVSDVASRAHPLRFAQPVRIGAREVVMTNQMLSTQSGDRLALLGLFLMLIVARLANHGGFLARRAIDAIAVIGWIADHLPRAALNGGM